MDNPSIIKVERSAMNPQRLALLSALTAVCLGVQLLPRPPNVEFTSLFVFVTGVVFGVVFGAMLGAFVMFVNGFLSPWGLAGMNMPFQVAGMVIAGILGGVYRMFAPRQMNSARFCLEAAVMGTLIALIFDLITNVGVGVQYMLAGMDPTTALFLALAYGSFFSLVHTFSNSAVFGLLFVPFVNVLNKKRVGELYWLKREHLSS